VRAPFADDRAHGALFVLLFDCAGYPMADLAIAPRLRADYKEEKEKEKDVRTSNIVAAKGI
jgi:hypothetical protein